jgi:hypothetical protein
MLADFFVTAPVAEFDFDVETSLPTTLAASWSLASTKWE